MNHYFNTNNEEGEELDKSEEHAKTQEEKILEFLDSHSGSYTPDEIHRLVLPNAVLTSVRRALTNLTTKGKLEKTSEMREGNYGKKVHTWKRKRNTSGNQMDLVF